MLFSIIIPIYNAEAYIINCIRNLERQYYTEMEIILIDDGSTDDSLRICNSWSKDSTGIHIIHKKNGGPASARNAGIRYASGRYCLFLDSDDYYLDNAIRNMEKYIEGNPDIIIGHFCVNDIQNNCIVTDRDSSLQSTDVEAIIHEIAHKRIAPCVWRYAINREFLINNGLFFDEDLTVAEDVLWTVKMLTKINSFKINNIVFYQYNIHSKSITASMSFDKLLDITKVCIRLYDYAIGQSDDAKFLAYTYICIITNNMLQYYRKQGKKEKKYLKKWIKNHSDMYDCALNTIPVMKKVSKFLGNYYTMRLAAEMIGFKLKKY